MTSQSQFFDSLARLRDQLHERPELDNEATRHDRLVLPFLTSSHGLGWLPGDIFSQVSIKVPPQVLESHVFREGAPIKRRPDLIIMPPEIAKEVAVIEEKARQSCLEDLDGYRMQTLEYQGLFNCTWAILTDGDKWIVRRNFERLHQFDSIHELRRGLADVRHCLGREAVIGRWQLHGTCDLLILSNISIATTEARMTQMLWTTSHAYHPGRHYTDYRPAAWERLDKARSFQEKYDIIAGYFNDLDGDQML